jgi:hypothetical protein
MEFAPKKSKQDYPAVIINQNKIQIIVIKLFLMMMINIAI